MDNARAKHLKWVRAILSGTGWTQTDLARRAGIDPSTLSRFLREVQPGATLNSLTIAALEKASGLPAFDTEWPQPQRGFAETEAEPLRVLPDSLIGRAVEAMTGGRSGVDAWIMRSRALELAGFMPGDVLIVDLNASPANGDAVCVQLYDKAGRAETAFRLYEAPFLVAAASDPALRRPVLIDPERAIVRGVVVASLRPRSLH